MPLIKDDRVTRLGQFNTNHEKLESSTVVPDVSKIYGAEFILDNPIVSMMTQEDGLPNSVWTLGELDPNFNPIDGLSDNYLVFSDRFAYANNPSEVEAVKRQIDKEMEAREIVANGGVHSYIAMFAAGLADPFNFLPIGGAAYQTYRSMSKGKNILKGAAVTGAAGMMGISASEAALFSTQSTRTYGEVGTNIAAGTVLSGLLGGVVSGYKRVAVDNKLADLETITKNIDEYMNLPDEGVPDSLSGDILIPDTALDTDTSIGAALSDRPTNLTLESFQSMLGVENVKNALPTFLNDPLFRTNMSHSLETRRAAQGLAEAPYRYNKNKLGIPTDVSVERKANMTKTRLFEPLVTLDEQFSAYRQSAFGKNITRAGDALGLNKTNKLSYQDFKFEVSKALRRGDKHEIPEVANAAKAFREKLFTPFKDEAIEAGIFSKDIDTKTAESYLNRQYNKEKIIAQRDTFKKINADWMESMQADIGRRFDETELKVSQEGKNVKAIREQLKEAKKAKKDKATIKELDKKLKASKEELDELKEQLASDQFWLRLGRDDLEDITEQLIDRIVGTPDGRLPYDIDLDDFVRGSGKGARGGKRGPMKARKHLIPDSVIEDFLENDIEYLATTYQRTMSADLALIKAFGDTDMTETLKKIADDWNAKIAKATTENQRKKLNKLKDRDIADIAGMRDRIRGTYALSPDGMNMQGRRVIGALKTLNFLRLMGQVVASSIGDISRALMTQKMGSLFGDGLAPLLTEFGKFRLAGNEAKLAGEALDLVMGGRIQVIADVMDNYGRHSGFERGLAGLGDVMGNVTGINHWNSALKQFTGVIVQSKIIKAANSVRKGRATAKEIEDLAASFIDVDAAKVIAREVERVGTKGKNIFVANTSEWDILDPAVKDALTKFRAAIGKEINRTIVTPGQDVPLWLSTPLGSLVGQFRSFSFASMNRVTMSALQERDMSTLTGISMMIGLGMLSAKIKFDIAGKDMPKDKTAWLLEGIDRSGVTGWLFDVNNILEKATGGGVGVSALVGKQPMSRYASHNVWGALLGPTFGIGGDVFQLSQNIGPGQEWTTSDTHALRRLLPFQNLIWIRRLLDKAEKNINNSLGIREPSKKR